MILPPKYSEACTSLSVALNTIPESVMDLAKQHNPWFDQDNIAAAASAWSEQLRLENQSKWLEKYTVSDNPSKVAIIMAGNIPFVGLHDVLSVIASGHHALCKLSSSDTVLMNYCIDSLNSVLENSIEIIDRVKEADAVIASGNNNSARVFETYFGKRPNLIRRNRTSVAVLSGLETKEQLSRLGSDIFSYFGLGCRNISKVYVPLGYDFKNFFEAIFSFGNVINHHKYANNYDYNKAIYLMGQEKFLDNNFLMLRRDEKSLNSPLSVLFYDYYITNGELKQNLLSLDQEIQCVASEIPLDLPRQVGLGETQKPRLWDYPDGIDTMQFLNTLSFTKMNHTQ